VTLRLTTLKSKKYFAEKIFFDGLQLWTGENGKKIVTQQAFAFGYFLVCLLSMRIGERLAAQRICPTIGVPYSQSLWINV
jgi:uncharacterized protein YebE (UPF0316 family)